MVRVSPKFVGTLASLGTMVLAWSKPVGGPIAIVLHTISLCVFKGTLLCERISDPSTGAYVRMTMETTQVRTPQPCPRDSRRRHIPFCPVDHLMQQYKHFFPFLTDVFPSVIRDPTSLAVVASACFAHVILLSD